MSDTFDPAKHIRKVSGADYLEVKWRLVWLRTDHPDALIDTDLISITDTHAIFKAVATIPNGGSATGYGSESKQDFRDFIEKAETKAIGRALGALGFGTQFADDFADASSGRIADAPVQRQTPRPAPVQHTQIDGPALREGIVNESKQAEAERNDTPERRKKGLAAVFAAGHAKRLTPDDVKAIAYRWLQVDSMTDVPAPRLSEFWKYLNDTDAETLAGDLYTAKGGK